MHSNNDKLEDSYRKLADMYLNKHNIVRQNNKQMSSIDADKIVESILLNQGSRLGLHEFE